jgi:hypothetical protein
MDPALADALATMTIRNTVTLILRKFKTYAEKYFATKIFLWSFSRFKKEGCKTHKTITYRGALYKKIFRRILEKPSQNCSPRCLGRRFSPRLLMC